MVASPPLSETRLKGESMRLKQIVRDSNRVLEQIENDLEQCRDLVRIMCDFPNQFFDRFGFGTAPVGR